EDQAETQSRPQLAANWARRVREFEKELKVIREAVGRMDEIAEQKEIKTAAE
ncbi:MAG: hypothetical protein JO237_12065, partial [Pseudolabrys sp.]|nr:hypothetical protein [Pseudolabrys sp.]